MVKRFPLRHREKGGVGGCPAPDLQKSVHNFANDSRQLLRMEDEGEGLRPGFFGRCAVRGINRCGALPYKETQQQKQRNTPFETVHFSFHPLSP